MNILDIANRHSRERAEADANVALLIVHPDERLDVQAMLDARPDCKIVHREPGVDHDTLLYVRCADEGEREGLERAWMSFKRFRRGLVQTWRERLRNSPEQGRRY
jgi:hypothetical protein